MQFELSFGPNIARDLTQLSAVEEQGYSEHLWEIRSKLASALLSQCESYQEVQGF